MKEPGINFCGGYNGVVRRRAWQGDKKLGTFPASLAESGESAEIIRGNPVPSSLRSGGSIPRHFRFEGCRAGPAGRPHTDWNGKGRQHFLSRQSQVLHKLMILVCRADGPRALQKPDETLPCSYRFAAFAFAFARVASASIPAFSSAARFLTPCFASRTKQPGLQRSMRPVLVVPSGWRKVTPR